MKWKPRRKRQKAIDSLLRPQAGYAPDSLRATMASYLEALTVLQYSPATCDARADCLLKFARWCEERGLMRPAEVTRPLLERYQRHLFYLRLPSGKPVAPSAQHRLLSVVRYYFRWLVRQNLLPGNPASELLLPRLGIRLPRYTMTAAEVEKVLARPDVTVLDGLRDRAMLEVLWATGMRRSEVCALQLFDVNASAGTVFIRQGKGKKDRVVPIGARALAWLQRYLEEVRPRFATSPDAGVLFLATTGAQLSPDILSRLVHDYVQAARVPVKGSCHLFRHACATQMLEGGADIRFVQEMLGHARLDTTVVYTRVSIGKLKAIYEATHPASQPVGRRPAAGDDVAQVSAEQLLGELADEADE